MSDPEFNPKSNDSMFATIMNELQTIKSTCNDIKAEAKKTNGRVTGLERFRDVLTARVSLISFFVAGGVTFLGWLINRLS